MEPFTQSRSGGGLWNSPRPTTYSKDTQDMLRVMMQESRLTNRQKRQINECLKNGTALPLPSDSTSASPSQPRPSKSAQTHHGCVAHERQLPAKPQRRTAESCRSGNSYVREKFRPAPTRDLEKEKRRLQSILATGQEEPPPDVLTCCEPEVKERDRYQEVLDEIEERRQFLEDMAALGQDEQYVYIINSEISQRLRELAVLDKAQGHKEDALTSERKEEECTTGRKCGKD